VTAGVADFPQQIAACKAGDSQAFARLWRSLQPALLRYLYIISTDAAEDLASETWLEVARSLHRFEGDEQMFRGWLFTIARHRYLDWVRRQGRRPRALATGDLPEQPSSDDPATAVLASLSTIDALNLIATLPPDQAEAIALRVIADLDVGRVAEIMQRQPGAVRVLTHRGLRRLAGELTSSTLQPSAIDGVTT
jgi:RNA polymerase sigma-70 factor (ECF subfamily)